MKENPKHLLRWLGRFTAWQMPAVVAIMIFAATAMAQPPQKLYNVASDSTFVFDFTTGSTYRSIPLYRFVRKHRQAITSGKLPIYIYSYQGSLPTDSLNKAKARSNSLRLKGTLIDELRLKERHFITCNFAYGYPLSPPVDGLVITFVTPDTITNQVKTETEVTEVLQVVVETDNDAQATDVEADAESQATISLLAKTEQVIALPTSETEMGVRANVLNWATLNPHLGFDLYWNHRWTMSLDGSYGHFAIFQSDSHLPRFTHIAAGVRRYATPDGEYRGFYLGAHATVQWYDWRPGTTGRDGHNIGLGLQGGYTLMFTPVWGIDLGLGAGVIYRQYNTYRQYEPVGKDYLTGHNKGWGVGLTRLDISLLYRFKL